MSRWALAPQNPRMQRISGFLIPCGRSSCGVGTKKSHNDHRSLKLCRELVMLQPIGMPICHRLEARINGKILSSMKNLMSSSTVGSHYSIWGADCD